MLKNNKGFTVIELIMSFAFSSVLAITLFSVIVTYRSKQVDSTIESELLAFKSHLIMDVQEDISIKGLKKIDYCEKYDQNNNIVANAIEPRCVKMYFNDNTMKYFQIKSQLKIDKIKNNDGTEKDYDYSIPYVIYGDIRYDIPDAASVYIDDDYILNTKSMYDGIETGTKLYRISFNLNHSDLDTNIAISIVANGTEKVSDTEGDYKSYNIGDSVTVQLNKEDQRKFVVIQASNKHNNSVVLLYNDVYDSSLILPSTDYNLLENFGSRYETSKIRSKVHAVEVKWNNATDVRLITTEEISRIAHFCPQYRGVDSPDVSLSSAPSWLFGEGSNKKSYWTMSEKLVTGNNNGKTVWYVNADNKSLTSSLVNGSYALRPVIVIQKRYITD